MHRANHRYESINAFWGEFCCWTPTDCCRTLLACRAVLNRAISANVCSQMRRSQWQLGRVPSADEKKPLYAEVVAAPS